jgi:hypothetical protein
LPLELILPFPPQASVHEYWFDVHQNSLSDKGISAGLISQHGIGKVALWANTERLKAKIVRSSLITRDIAAFGERFTIEEGRLNDAERIRWGVVTSSMYNTTPPLAPCTRFNIDGLPAGCWLNCWCR